MFWIPIFAIFIVIWLIRYTVDGVKMTKFNNEYERKTALRESMRDRTASPDLEQRLFREYERKYDAWGTIVQEFMGGGEEWRAYADFETGKLKAVTALMLKDGKLPRVYTDPLGVKLGMSEKSPSVGHENGFYNNITGNSAARMNERFMLMVEDTLHRHGIDATVVCQRYLGVQNTPPYISLRKLITKYGDGCTGFGTSYIITYWKGADIT